MRNDIYKVHELTVKLSSIDAISEVRQIYPTDKRFCLYFNGHELVFSSYGAPEIDIDTIHAELLEAWKGFNNRL